MGVVKVSVSQMWSLREISVEFDSVLWYNQPIDVRQDCRITRLYTRDWYIGIMRPSQG